MLRDSGSIRAKKVKTESSRAMFPEERPHTQRLGSKDEYEFGNDIIKMKDKGSVTL